MTMLVVLVQPLLVPTVTEYVPLCVTTAWLVMPIWAAPAEKVKLVPPPAVIVTEAGTQAVRLLAESVATGGVLSAGNDRILANGAAVSSGDGDGVRT